MCYLTRIVLLATLILGASSARADTQTWNVAAQCDPNSPFTVYDCSEPSNIRAVLTTQTETGNFHEYEFNTSVPSADVVTGILGAFDGMPMTLVPNAPGDWINSAGLPESILFMAGGDEYKLFPDFDIAWLFPQSGTGTGEPLIWNAVDPIITPESPIFPMALTGMLALLIGYWLKRRHEATS